MSAFAGWLNTMQQAGDLNQMGDIQSGGLETKQPGRIRGAFGASSVEIMKSGDFKGFSTKMAGHFYTGEAAEHSIGSSINAYRSSLDKSKFYGRQSSRAIGAGKWMRQGLMDVTGRSSLTAIGAGALKGLPSVVGGSLLLGGITMAATGEEFTAGNLAHTFKEGVMLDLSFRMVGMTSSIGWGFLGSTLGMSSGETLAAMGATTLAVGSVASALGVGTMATGLAATVGIGNAFLPAMAVYGLGRASYSFAKGAHGAGQAARRTQFASGDMSFATSNAATMRQRALSAIQNSQMNGRAMLGNEASAYARAVGY